MKYLILIIVMFISVCVKSWSQTVTQLDDDNYYVQYENGTNETVSLKHISTNVRGCQDQIDRYSNVLDIINGDTDGLVSKEQFSEAVNSVKTKPVGNLGIVTTDN